LLATLANIKGRIVHFRSNGDGKKNTVINKVKRYILKKLIIIFSTDIIAVSQATMNSVLPARKIARKKSKVIYNGFHFMKSEKPSVSNIKQNYNLDENDVLFLHV